MKIKLIVFHLTFLRPLFAPQKIALTFALG